MAKDLAKDAYNKVYDQIHEDSIEMSGDWFVTAATRGELYYNLLGVPGDKNTEGSDKKFLEFFYADLDKRHLRGEHFSVGLGPGQSGVSITHNRLFHRGPIVDKNDRDRVTGYYYFSEDFDKSEGDKNVFDNPLNGKNRSGGETIVGLYKEDDKGKKMVAQFYSLNDDKGKRLTEVSAAKGIVSHEENKRHNHDILNGMSCMSCHDNDKKNEQGIIVPTHGNPLAEHIRDEDTFSNADSRMRTTSPTTVGSIAQGYF